MLLLTSGTASGQPARISEFGKATTNNSVSPGMINNARTAVGTIGSGAVFMPQSAGESTEFIPIIEPFEDSSATGISEDGIIAGIVSRQNQTTFRIETIPVLYDTLNGGSPQLLDIGSNPDTYRGYPGGISADGFCVSGAVGPWRIGDGPGGHTLRPVRWIDGNFEDVGQDDLVFFSIGGINNNGEMVGTARPEPGPNTRHAYAYLGGEWRDLGTLGGDQAFARDINNDGVIVGNAQDETGQLHAFRWDPIAENMTRLDSPLGYTSAAATVVNRYGDAAGSASLNGQATAVFWPGNSTNPIDLNDFLPPNSGWSRLERVTGMNDCGVFIGQGTRTDRPGEFSGFVLELTPAQFSQGRSATSEGDCVCDCEESADIKFENKKPHEIDPKRNPCPADINRDGVLTASDVHAWQRAFLANDAAADQNNDGIVSPADFSAWLRGYNAGC